MTLAALTVCMAMFCPPPQDASAAGLVARLGAASFREREAASAALEALGGRALTALETGAGHADPEVAARCRRLVERINDHGAMPWIDMSPAAARWWRPYLDRARPGHASQGTMWPEYREATRLWLVDLRRANVPDWFLREMLAEMADAETTYRVKHSMPNH